MPITNAQIAAAFEQVADLLELQDANPFRVRAYRNAARVVGDLQLDLAAQIAAGNALPKLPGVGPDLGAKIAELARTGRLGALERLRERTPSGLDELLRLPGLGPKRVRALYDELHVHTPAQVLRAARDGRIRALPGFGLRTEQRIAQAIGEHLANVQRFRLAVAAPYADALLVYVRQAPGVQTAVAAGSLRRRRDTVGDIDLLAIAADGAAVCRHFVRHPDVRDVLQAGDTRASVVLASGLQVDLRVVSAPSFGAALMYFTGSKAHSIRLRNRALDRGFKLNEYGLYRGRRAVAGATEEEVYAALGLPWIAPELREDRGEIEAGEAGTLPQLVEPGDLRGDLQVHTDWGDGNASIEAMADAARERGLGWLAICDPSRRAAASGGLDAARLAKQRDEIARLNRRRTAIRLLAGIEVDIGTDGMLDLPDDVLAPLDLVVAAVHSKLDLARARQTERILAALDHPHVRILAQPRAAAAGARDPFDADMLAIVRKCKARGIALAVSVHPERLDLGDIHCRMARDEGVPLAIGSDARAVGEFDYLGWGVGRARRGWLGKVDVLNTKPLAELRAWLARPRVERALTRARRGA